MSFTVPVVLWDDSPRVRESDPVTSHEAADSNNVSKSQRDVIQALQWNGPCAQFEAEAWLARYASWSPSRVRSAFSELEALGKVKRTDQFRLTPSGRRAQVWSLT